MIESPVAVRKPETTLRSQFETVRKHSEALCAPLQPEDYVVQPMVDVSPPKWHLAHTTWFWEEFVLAPHMEGYQRFHPQFSFMFNSYYESIGARVLRPERGNMSRPTTREVVAYRHYVDEHMLRLLENEASHLEALITVGLNHEQQHQELLLTDIKYILGHNPLFPAYQEDFKESSPGATNVGFTEMIRGIYKIGAPEAGFSFDNEHGRHDVLLEDFAISHQLVSNAEYLAFMESGGYQKSQYWFSDGWAWLKENNIQAPLYWHWIDGRWHRYALRGLEVVQPEEPVTHVSLYEAAAYAEWRGMRLPNEFEWEAASTKFTWGERWEHTNSAYLPYPGYKRAAGALGEYNGKFMVNQMVLRGASVATPDGHSRATYRNFFPPSARWQFTGIRLCK